MEFELGYVRLSVPWPPTLSAHGVCSFIHSFNKCVESPGSAGVGMGRGTAGNSTDLALAPGGPQSWGKRLPP